MPSSRGGKGQIPPAIGSALKISCVKNFAIIPVQLKKLCLQDQELIQSQYIYSYIIFDLVSLYMDRNKSLAELILSSCSGSASEEIYNNNVLATSGATSLRYRRSIKKAQNKKTKRDMKRKANFR